MLLGILTLITALSISAVAIYYSVAGLVAIFAAAALPIMIMGGVLEVGKLVTAVWLHRYWKQATWWLKTYLSIAVLVLMLITSMGIFGFLSKAHIEQTAQSTDNLARVETMQSEIDRNLAIVGRAENRIRELESVGTGSDANIQSQIDKEQERIDLSFDRIKPAIQEQNQIIAGVTALFQTELDRIDEELARLQGFINDNEIEKAQAMVGTAVDGDYGPNTARAFTEFQEAKRAERNEWLQKIQDAAQSPTVVAARNEIQRLRTSAEGQVKQSQLLITRLQTQLADSDNADEVQTAIDEQSERIRTASLEVDRLTEEKIVLESEYRKLEAEVGPIKYIAEFVYGETADKNMLEEAVRWVIIVIIFVFDPLAVLLLIASQYTFEFNRKRKDEDGERLRQWREYEQKRAQAIVDNPRFTPSTTVPQDAPDIQETNDENTERENSKQEQQDAEELRSGQDEESLQTEIGNDPNVAETAQERGPIDVTTDTITTNDIMGDMVPKDNTTDTNGTAQSVESIEVPSDEDEEIIATGIEQAKRKALIDELDDQEEYKKLKQQWKEDHPDDNIKTYKKLYIHGKIDKLPWLDIPNTKNRFFYREELDGYVQNAEQGESSLWKDINKNK